MSPACVGLRSTPNPSVFVARPLGPLHHVLHGLPEARPLVPPPPALPGPPDSPANPQETLTN